MTIPFIGIRAYFRRTVDKNAGINLCQFDSVLLVDTHWLPVLALQTKAKPSNRGARKARIDQPGEKLRHLSTIHQPVTSH